MKNCILALALPLKRSLIVAMIAVAIVSTAGFGGCDSPKVKSSPAVVHDLLSDSATRTVIQNQIAEDPKLSLSQLDLMIQKSHVDTTMRDELCRGIASDSVLRLELTNLLSDDAPDADAVLHGRPKGYHHLPPDGFVKKQHR
jgi:hypothetical protein